jgi:hypothetical protein
MISNALEAGGRLTRSSTFWASLLLPALKVLSSHFLGIDVPWEVVLAGIGAQGVRNAAEHVANGMRDAADSRSEGTSSVGNLLGSLVTGALGLPKPNPVPAGAPAVED